jgi:hypothetical protein
MTTIRAHIYRRLTTGSTAIAGLVGARVYRTRLPQRPTLPAIVYQRIGGPQLFGTTGAIPNAMPLFQVTCLAEHPDTAEDLADAVRAHLNSWVSSTAGVQDCRVENEIDGDNPSAGPIGAHHIALTVELFHNL